MAQNIIYSPRGRTKGPWLCPMTTLSFRLFWLFSFVLAFLTYLIKLILGLKFSTGKRQAGDMLGGGGKELLRFNTRHLSLPLLPFCFVLLAPRGIRDLSSLCSLKWKHGVLIPGPPGKSPFYFSWSDQLEMYPFYWSFQMTSFGFHWFSPLFVRFLFHPHLLLSLLFLPFLWLVSSCTVLGRAWQLCPDARKGRSVLVCARTRVLTLHLAFLGENGLPWWLSW